MTSLRSIAITVAALPWMASCADASGSPEAFDADAAPFVMAEVGTFIEPWALAVEPGTGSVFVTEQEGRISFVQPNGKLGFVSGVPKVAYGGQGGLGDFVFAPDYARSGLVYLSWAEAGDGDTRGAAVGRAKLVCEDHDSCDLRDLEVIWRQTPKVSGFGHYSHRIAFSPDGAYLFVASGDRQKQDPAQDLSNTLGTIVRLLPDGTAAPGNPFAQSGGARAEIWSYGQRNILGMAFDPAGQLWEVEHGPRGGDELNRVEPGANYGWPIVSNGRHYRGAAIPDHDTRPDFAAPAISWTPVIAPGGMIFYTGEAFADWQGDALITGMKSEALIRVTFDDAGVREAARYPMPSRVRAIAQDDAGAIWIAEDSGEDSRLFRLTPRD